MLFSAQILFNEDGDSGEEFRENIVEGQQPSQSVSAPTEEQPASNSQTTAGPDFFEESSSSSLMSTQERNDSVVILGEVPSMSGEPQPVFDEELGADDELVAESEREQLSSTIVGTFREDLLLETVDCLHHDMGELDVNFNDTLSFELWARPDPLDSSQMIVELQSISGIHSDAGLIDCVIEDLQTIYIEIPNGLAQIISSTEGVNIEDELTIDLESPPSGISDPSRLGCGNVPQLENDPAITINVVNIETSNLLQLVADEYGLNIIVDDSVRGRVSFNMRNVRLSEVVGELLCDFDLEYEINDDVLSLYLMTRP